MIFAIIKLKNIVGKLFVFLVSKKVGIFINIKEWLERGKELSKRISELEEEKQRLYEIATGTADRTNVDRVQTGHRNSSERKMILYATMSERLDKEREKLLSVLNEIVNLIALVDDITYRRLLSMRYIELMKWEDIAEEMHHNERYIFKLHKKALSEAEATLNK